MTHPAFGAEKEAMPPLPKACAGGIDTLHSQMVSQAWDCQIQTLVLH